MKAFFFSLFWLFSLNLHAATIDTFEGVYTKYQVESATTVSGTTINSSAMGGGRTVEVDPSTSTFGNNATVGLGFYSHNSGPGSSYNSRVTWQDNTGFDFTDNGRSGKLDVDVIFSDQPFNIRFDVADTFNQLSSGLLENVTTGIFSLLFSDFLGGADFSAVKSFRMTILQTNNATDLALNSISTSAVPVPAALWLFAPVLLGLIGLRHKK